VCFLALCSILVSQEGAGDCPRERRGAILERGRKSGAVGVSGVSCELVCSRLLAWRCDGRGFIERTAVGMWALACHFPDGVCAQ
jgi:hypothetical protein